LLFPVVPVAPRPIFAAPGPTIPALVPGALAPGLRSFKKYITPTKRNRRVFTPNNNDSSSDGGNGDCGDGDGVNQPTAERKPKAPKRKI
ncbi:hypothetical protein BGX21_004066, partial [Mortierella sp. AD011]